MNELHYGLLRPPGAMARPFEGDGPTVSSYDLGEHPKVCHQQKGLCPSALKSNPVLTAVLTDGHMLPAGPDSAW